MIYAFLYKYNIDLYVIVMDLHDLFYCCDLGLKGERYVPAPLYHRMFLIKRSVCEHNLCVII